MYPKLLEKVEASEDVRNFLASFPFSESTKDSYARAVLKLIEFPVADWKASDLLKFVNRPEWGTNHRYTVMAACQKFIHWKYGGKHPALAARVKRGGTKRQRWLPPERALELLASFNTFDARGARDLAICALALDTGLRCSELCRLSLAHVDLEKRKLQVIVKGGEWSDRIFSVETAQYIDRWLSFRARIAAADVENVFVSFQHQNPGGPLTREGLQGMFKRWGDRLGLRLSPHDMRRSFATLSTLNGAPSRVVQAAGGWKNMIMVQRYTQWIDERAIETYLPVTRLGEERKA